MEPLKIVVVQKFPGYFAPNSALYSAPHIKKSEVFFENWKSGKLKKLKAHLVILDPELQLDQAQFAIKLIRSKSDIIPIIAIRTENSIDFKGSLFHLGLDDYICAPFDPRELVYRIDALIRRARQLNATTTLALEVADFFFDYSNLTIKFATGITTHLTQRQADLIHFFCKNADILLERGEILHHIWGKDDYYLGRSMDVIIASLRKLLTSSQLVKLETVHGKGFIFHVNTK